MTTASAPKTFKRGDHVLVLNFVSGPILFRETVFAVRPHGIALVHGAGTVPFEKVFHSAAQAVTALVAALEENEESMRVAIKKSQAERKRIASGSVRIVGRWA